MNCRYCGKPVDLPFKCPFCGGYFCPDHRLPENHACPEIWKVMQRRREDFQRIAEGEMPKEEHSYIYEPRFKAVSRWSSSTEILHLAVGALLVMAVGLSMFIPIWYLGSFLLHEPWIALSSALAFLSIFILHELAHKAAAKHYGLWAEFRLTLLGALITFLSMFSPIIKLVSPGSVMISGEADKRIVGITALAGPFTNVVLSFLFLFLSFLVPNGSSSSIMIPVAMLSSWISLLNLIPFSIMDGAKIFWWNRRVWAISFSTSLLMFALLVMWPF